MHNITHLKLLHLVKNTTLKFESRSDQKRHQKFENLIRARDTDFNTTNVINRTDVFDSCVWEKTKGLVHLLTIVTIFRKWVN